jgi:lipoprotein NlpD
LIRGFGASEGLVNGIGIGGQVGQEIRAAAAGRVVYAGNGIPAYGQLVIVNHNDSFLSAYGYNDELVVTQGQDVSAGQIIARMGLGPGRQPLLHFEIRQNGTPVDPLLHLPR